MPTFLSTNLPILCVDDNLQMRSSLKSGFESLGFEVITACHGIDAFGLFEDYDGRFEGVLTDHKMPHMDGMEFSRLIRRTGFAGKIAVMSSKLTALEKDEYRLLGVLDFLTKPLSLPVLKDCYRAGNLCPAGTNNNPALK